jgi:mono/diheme cytochrome c family protein
MKKLLIPAALVALIPGAALADNSGPGGGGAALLTADASGQQVYTTVCQGCHMADGKGAGARGAFRRWRATPMWQRRNMW